MSTDIIEKLDRIEQRLQDQQLPSRGTLNLKEACQYLGISTSCIYKMTSQRRIPFYRPGGKRLYFKREDLDQWMLSNRVEAESDIERRAYEYLIKNPIKK